MAKTATTWRDIGEQIYQHRARERQANKKKIERDQDAPLFTALLASALGGTNVPLVTYLRSEKQFSLSQESREHLALVITFQEKKRRKVGRKQNKVPRFLAKMARSFYRQWQAANVQAGMSNWGLAKDMKDESCRYTLELIARAWVKESPGGDGGASASGVASCPDLRRFENRPL